MKTPSKNPGTVEVRALSIEDFCRAVSLGRTRVFAEIKQGKLKVRKVGRRTLIPVEEMERWLDSLSTVDRVGLSER